MPVDTAAAMIHAAGAGVTLAVIAGADDGELSVRTREAILAAVTVPGEASGEAPEDGTASSAARAVALRAALRTAPPPGLTASETALLGEWLDRIAANP